MMEQRGVIVWAIIAAIAAAGGLFYFLSPAGPDADNLAARVTDGQVGDDGQMQEMTENEDVTPEEAQARADAMGGVMADAQADAQGEPREASVAGAASNAAETTRDEDQERQEDVALTAETGASEFILVAALLAMILGASGLWRFAWRPF